MKANPAAKAKQEVVAMTKTNTEARTCRRTENTEREQNQTRAAKTDLGDALMVQWSPSSWP
jgi:hypothetical protein